MFSVEGMKGGGSDSDPLGPSAACWSSSFVWGTGKCLKMLSAKGGTLSPARSSALRALAWGAGLCVCVSHPESWGVGRFHVLQVGAQESMWEILHRCLPFNAHAASYTWKYEGKKLNMDYTLEENGIRDEDEEFDYLNMDGTLYTPAILLYFNDDLTEL